MVKLITATAVLISVIAFCLAVGNSTAQAAGFSCWAKVPAPVKSGGNATATPHVNCNQAATAEVCIRYHIAASNDGSIGCRKFVFKANNSSNTYYRLPVSFKGWNSSRECRPAFTRVRITSSASGDKKEFVSARRTLCFVWRP